MKQSKKIWWGGGNLGDRALLSNLVSYFPFDSNANDTLGTNNGTAVGSPSLVAAKVSNGYSLNGTTQYIKLNDNNSLSFGNAGTDTAFSISMWVNPTTFIALTRFINKRDNVGPNFEWELGCNSTGYMLGFLFSAGAATNIIRPVATSNPLTLSTWNHVVFTYNGNKAFSGIKMYVNGSQCTLTDNSTGTYAGMNNTAAYVNIGSVLDGVQPFTGIIDEVGIWGKELSQANVTALYNGGNGLAYSSFT